MRVVSLSLSPRICYIFYAAAAAGEGKARRVHGDLPLNLSAGRVIAAPVVLRGMLHVHTIRFSGVGRSSLGAAYRAISVGLPLVG